MGLIMRRNLIAAGLGLGVNLAALPSGRKSNAQTILPLRTEASIKLASMEALTPQNPPLALAAHAFTDAEGKPASLTDFLGRGVVLNMWATWCAPCVAEMPALNALAARLDGSGILVLPLSSDRGGAAVVRRFYAAHSIDHLGLWLDPHGEAAQAWGARGLPTTLIIDRHGMVRAKLEGGAEWASDAAVADIRRLAEG